MAGVKCAAALPRACVTRGSCPGAKALLRLLVATEAVQRVRANIGHPRAHGHGGQSEAHGSGGHTKVDPAHTVGTVALAGNGAYPAHARGIASTLHAAAGNGSFLLLPTSPDGRAPALWDINGGRMCVGLYGREPPRFELVGTISLEQCATIARMQPRAIGFRWGRGRMDVAGYDGYVLGRPPEAAPDLNRLFLGVSNTTCAVYVADDEVDWQVNVLGHEPSYHWGVGSEICDQRWNLGHLLRSSEKELWFCYGSLAAGEQCREGRGSVRLQSIISVVAGAFFVAGLSYVARDLRQFEASLSVAVRPPLCASLGVWAVARLLDLGPAAAPGFLLPALAICLVVAAQHLLLMPYRFAQRWGKAASAPRLWSLLLLAFSPCLYADCMCYYAPFPPLIAEAPVALGIIACLLAAVVPAAAERWRKLTAPAHYAPMESKGSSTLPDGV